MDPLLSDCNCSCCLTNITSGPVEKMVDYTGQINELLARNIKVPEFFPVKRAI